MTEYLSNFGFTQGEEKVYFALLKLGTTTSGKIAKEAKVSRSKLYEILEKLSRKGFVSHFKRNNISNFHASDPRNLLTYIEKKEEVLREKKNSFKKQLPYLQSLINDTQLKKEAEVFEGIKGIKTVRETFLKKMRQGDTIDYFGNPDSGHKNMLGYWDDFNKRRVARKIKSRTIYNQDAFLYGERRKRLKFTEVKYLPKKGNTHAWIEIYGDSVAIVLKHKTPMSVVINDKFVAESFKTYFKILWDVSKVKLESLQTASRNCEKLRNVSERREISR